MHVRLADRTERSELLTRLAPLADLARRAADLACRPSQRVQTAALSFAVMVALAIRVWLLATTDFPINDGGLFARFVDATAERFPALPVWAPYNGNTLPFAYPPLGFWLAAAARHLGASTLSLLHVAPILMNAAYVLLFAVLLLRMGFSRLFAAIALLSFATSFRSFEWLVMGGGLTRGLGSIFTLLALIALQQPDRAPPRFGALAAAGASVAGAVMSHLEWGLLAAASSVWALALSAGSVRAWVQRSLIVGGAAILLTLPWALFVIGEHGLAPFTAASKTSDWYNGWKLGPFWRAYWVVRDQSGAMLPLVALGGLGLLLRRQLFWPGFLLLCLFLTPRQGPTPAALAFGVLSAEGAFDLAALAEGWLGRRLSAGIAAALLLVAGGARNGWSLQPDPAFQPLTRSERAAMAWIARTQPAAAFAVITEPGWMYDRTAEWLPYLTRARSTTTIQGLEWLPGDAFNRSLRANTTLKASAKTCSDLLAAIGALPPADYILAEQRPDCFRSAGYALAFADGNLSIWDARRGLRPGG